MNLDCLVYWGLWGLSGFIWFIGGLYGLLGVIWFIRVYES
jgi:hypothetical protein